VHKRATRLTLALGIALVIGACSSGGGSSPSPSAAGSATGSETSAPTTATSPSAAASGQTYSGNGVSFQYPESWQNLKLTGTKASTGSQLWNQTFGIDGVNFVSVSGYAINVPITSADIDQQKNGIGQQIAGLFTQAGGSLDSGPTVETMAGLPALGFTGTAQSPNGQSVNSRLVLAFDGTTEYFVNCQYDTSGQSEIVSGCDMVVGTFALG